MPPPPPRARRPWPRSHVDIWATAPSLPTPVSSAGAARHAAATTAPPVPANSRTALQTSLPAPALLPLAPPGARGRRARDAALVASVGASPSRTRPGPSLKLRGANSATRAVATAAAARRPPARLPHCTPRQGRPPLDSRPVRPPTRPLAPSSGTASGAPKSRSPSTAAKHQSRMSMHFQQGRPRRCCTRRSLRCTWLRRN
mmetsp:Transcript_38423/g.110290  ORF Transcript_38423/g.110290 Transcript_38423/m.110290 type:complete len:201 (+) Transcript_38423:1887-2489(+)